MRLMDAGGMPVAGACAALDGLPQCVGRGRPRQERGCPALERALEVGLSGRLRDDDDGRACGGLADTPQEEEIARGERTRDDEDRSHPSVRQERRYEGQLRDAVDNVAVTPQGVL